MARHTPVSKLKGASAVFQRQRDTHGRLVKTEKDDSEDEDVEYEEGDTDSEEESDSEDRRSPSPKKAPKRKRFVVDSDSEEASPRRTTKRQRTKATPRYRFPEHLTATPSRKGKALASDSEENTISDPPSVTKRTKRKQAFDDDSDSEDGMRPPKKRRPIATPSRKRKQPVVEDSDSDLEDGAYQGPKSRKKTQAPRRTSGRVRRVIGSYKLDRAVDDVVDKEEVPGNEEDDSIHEEEGSGDESEDDLE